MLQLGTALVLVAVLTSAVLVIDREHRSSPFVAFGAAVLQALMLLGMFDFLRDHWYVVLGLPTAQFIVAYNVWADTTRKRPVTASAMLLVVTFLELGFLLGRIRP